MAQLITLPMLPIQLSEESSLRSAIDRSGSPTVQRDGAKHMQRDINDEKTALSKNPSIRGKTWPLDVERELVEEARKGSEDAFEQLVGGYSVKILRIACSITRHYQDAEDVMQTTFLKAFNKLPLFRGDSSFYTWLASIAVNEALMRIRRRRNEVLIEKSEEIGDAESADDFIHAAGPNPEQSCSHHEVRRILAAAINKLKPGQRVIFHLRDIEGLSLHEIAESLNLTLPAVKTRLHRARIALRRSLYYLVRPQNGSMTRAWEQPRSYEDLRAALRPLR